MCELTKQAVDESKAVAKASVLAEGVATFLDTVKGSTPSLGIVKLQGLMASCLNLTENLRACKASSANGSAEAVKVLEESTAAMQSWVDSASIKDAENEFSKVLQDLWLGEPAEPFLLPCRQNPAAMQSIWNVVIKGQVWSKFCL